HAATPPLHPLSLHDALPICSPAVLRLAERAEERALGEARRPGVDDLHRCESEGRALGRRGAGRDDSVTVAARRRRERATMQEQVDRKSTRLNSSHVSISYAV